MAIVNSVKNMQIGDKIICKYVAGSNALGIFSELGTSQVSLLTPTPSATPNGSFYWIMVGYDHFGRKKLIADRYIQTSIAFNTLLNSGTVYGNEINIDGITSQRFILRLMSGGVSATDKDNEWDKIIVESTLNGTIVAGDNSVWNWNMSFAGHTKSVGATGTNSMYSVSRGFSSDISWYATSDAPATAGANRAYRPVLLVEQLNLPPNILNIQLNQTNVWYGETGNINLTANITDIEGDRIRYNVSVNDVEVIPFSMLQDVPSYITVQIPKSAFTQSGSNLLRLTVEDEASKRATYEYNIILENIDTNPIVRIMDFRAKHTQQDINKTQISSPDGFKLQENIEGSYYMTTTNRSQITTLGKSNIVNITVDGGNDIQQDITVIEDISNRQPIGIGTVQEFQIVLNRFKDYKNIIVKEKS